MFALDLPTGVSFPQVDRAVLAAASLRLRFCPKCIALRYHGRVQQLLRHARCPIHGKPLQTTCRRCELGVSARRAVARCAVQVPALPGPLRQPGHTNNASTLGTRDTRACGHHASLAGLRRERGSVLGTIRRPMLQFHNCRHSRPAVPHLLHAPRNPLLGATSRPTRCIGKLPSSKFTVAFGADSLSSTACHSSAATGVTGEQRRSGQKLVRRGRLHCRECLGGGGAQEPQEPAHSDRSTPPWRARSATGRPRPPDQPLAGLDPRAARPACQPKQQVRESSNICGIDDSAP